MPRPGLEHRFRVCLHDTDAAGVMFYGHIFRYAHDAYEGLMAALGSPVDALIRAGCRLPLVHAEADYLLPLRHGDEVRVAIGVESLGATSFTLGYRFRDGSGALLAQARTVHVHLGQGGEGAAPLPGGLRAALATAAQAGQQED